MEESLSENCRVGVQIEDHPPGLGRFVSAQLPNVATLADKARNQRAATSTCARFHTRSVAKDQAPPATTSDRRNFAASC